MKTHKHIFRRSKPTATVEICTCGKFRFTGHAGLRIEAVEFIPGKSSTQTEQGKVWDGEDIEDWQRQSEQQGTE